VSGPVSGCIGYSSELCVPAGYTSYVWNTGDTTPCISVSTPGNYSVTIHDPVGCVANSFYNLPFNPPPAVSISGSAGVCNGNTVSWCAPAGFVTYQWSNGGTSVCINVSQDTTYTVEVTDQNGCYATASRDLNIVSFSPDIFEFNNQLICDTFNTSFTYEWLVNGQPTGCSGDTCDPAVSGLYSVIVTDTSSGCSETATYNYIFNTVNETSGSDFKIYPNPFDGNSFSIETGLQEKALVTVYNSIGEIVWQRQIFSGKTLVTLQQATAGVYFVCLKSEKRNLILKIVATN
jgi:hypothetical protein